MDAKLSALSAELREAKLKQSEAEGFREKADIDFNAMQVELNSQTHRVTELSEEMEALGFELKAARKEKDEANERALMVEENAQNLETRLGEVIQSLEKDNSAKQQAVEELQKETASTKSSAEETLTEQKDEYERHL